MTRRGAVTRLASTRDALTATVADQQISVGRSGDSPVVLDAGDNGSVRMRLPNVAGTTSSTAADGTIVYRGRKVSTSVQVLVEGNVRAAVTLHERGAPTDHPFTFELPAGYSLRLSPDDGGVDIVAADNAFVIGRVGAPWAKDATGRALRTWYTVDGATVTQHIDTSGATYPVVADPDVKYNCGWTSCNATFSRWYTANVLQPSVANIGGAAAGMLAGGMMCGKIPNGAFVTACAAYVFVYSVATVVTINRAKAKKQCFTVRFNYIGAVSPINAISVGVNSDSNCRNS
ncbi:MAG: hypothetical protein JXA67_18695 [Micromonosporaceae bacterium]|nr:hypothetical protein [Micromonosporaceae bacterium]